MALSGNIFGSTNNSYIDSKLAWSAKQSLTGNYSDVTVVLTYSRNNTGYQTGGTWKGGITINGSRTPGEKSIVITHNSDTVAMSATTRVYHSADGTKSIYISADGGISGTSLGSTSIGSTVTLDTIPRISKPTVSVDTLYFGQSVTIYTNRASESFTHRLWYKYLDSGWVEITPTASVTTSYSWTVPKALMNNIPQDRGLAITIGCDTYYGNTYLGYDVAYLTVWMEDVEDSYPKIGNISWTSSNAEPSGWPMTQGISKGVMLIERVTEAYSSPIVSYSLTFAGLSSTNRTLIVDNISSSGTLKAVATVTDARGRSTTKEVEFIVADYSAPKLNVVAYRSDASGVEDATGDYLCVIATASITSVGNNAIQSLTLEYKQRSAYSYGEPITLTPDTAKVVSASSNSTWDWVVSVSDKVHAVSDNGAIPTGEVVLDILANGKGIGLGKVAEKEGLDSAWDFMKNGVKQVDFVTEQGTSGIWTYRKWASGISECWGLYEATGAVINVAWGYLFETASQYQFSFPTGLFVSNPVANFSVPTATGGVLALETLGETTKDQTCSIFPVRATPSTLDFTIATYAIGRWK